VKRAGSGELPPLGNESSTSGRESPAQVNLSRPSIQYMATFRLRCINLTPPPRQMRRIFSRGVSSPVFTELFTSCRTDERCGEVRLLRLSFRQIHTTCLAQLNRCGAPKGPQFVHS